MKHVTKEAKRASQMQFSFPKLKIYIKNFSLQVLSLGTPLKQHISHHAILCQIIFEEWGNSEKIINPS
jgi:hypothetical protein